MEAEAADGEPPPQTVPSASSGQKPQRPTESNGSVSFERFFHEMEPQLRRLAVLYTGDVDQAHDLAQEALVRAWEYWEKVSRHPHPDAWCRTVLHNLAVSRLRRRRLERLAARRTDRVPEPSTEHIDVSAALRRLPANQRRAVLLHYVLGFSTEEISQEVGAPAGTVRSWLSRARQTMAAALADDGPGEPKGLPDGRV